MRESLGLKLWSEAQDAIEDNLQRGEDRKNRILMVARVRKARLQRQWKDTGKRRRALEDFARSLTEERNDNTPERSAAESALVFLEQSVEVVDFKGAANCRDGHRPPPKVKTTVLIYPTGKVISRSP